MTSIAMPTSPQPNGIGATLLRFGRRTQPMAGGVIQQISRLGSRWALSVSLPPLTEAQARAWNAARIQSVNEGSTVTMAWTQPLQASLGSPLVNGAGQAGSLLVADGFTAGAAIPQLAFFNYTVDSRVYLEATVTAVTANGSGQATLPIAPMLRATPVDNSALNFTTPQIEGFLDAGDVEWSVDVMRLVGVGFTITENR